jgi:hypothetical protein
MNALLQAINPVGSIKTEGEAKTAARAGALGAFLMAAYAVVVVMIMTITAESYAANLREFTQVLYGPGSEAARIVAGVMSPAMVYGLAAWILICALGLAVIGVAQWRKLTRLIPLILGLVTLYGVLMFALGKISGNSLAPQMQVPLWREVLWVVVNIVEIALFWAGVRGGNRLNQLRRAEA